MSTDPPARGKPSFSIPSIVAAIAAVAIFFTEGWDVLLAVVAVLFGLLGLGLAAAPSVRGGIVSIVSVIIALVAMVGSLFQVIF